jgi:5-methylcytosine-specific restriction protein A
MPRAAKRPCTYPGCGVLTETGRCPQHQFVEKKAHEAQRSSSTQRGYGYRWQQASKGFLRQHPLCQCPECDEGRIRVREATVVDHRIPHRGDMKLFWDRSNWQSMHKDCHDVKTAREDGAFGNPRRGGGPGQKSGSDRL